MLASAVGLYAYRASLRPVVLLQVGSYTCSDFCFAQALTDKLQGVDFLTARQGDTLKFFKQQVTQDFIIKSVITDWAQRHAVFVKEDEITKHIDEVRQQYPNDLQLKETLAERGLNLQKWRQKIKYTLLEKKVLAYIHKNLQPQYSDEELKTYYNQNHDRFKLKAQVKLSQILLPSMSEAQMLRQKIKKRPKAFNSLPNRQAGYKMWAGWSMVVLRFLTPPFRSP